jgi:ABC-type multidrug transport system fused ATPase/permease subunit
MIFLVLSSSAALTFPYFTGELFSIEVIQTPGKINQIGMYLALILICQAVFSYFRIWLFSIVTEKVSADIRYTVYDKLISLPINFYDKNRTGELSSRLTSDVSQIQDTLSSTLAEFFRQIATLVVGITIISFISPKLTIFMLLTFPVLVLSALIFGKFIRTLSKQKQDELAKANIVVEETLQAVRIVKSFTNQLFELGRYKKALDTSVKTALKAARYRSAFVSFIIAAIFGGIVLVIWYGSTLVSQGLLKVSDLTKFVLYTGFIGGAVGGLGDLYSQLQKTIGSSERLLEILDEHSEPDKSIDSPKVRFLGDIQFKDVYFSYPSRPDVEVLKGINFEVMAGKKVAIVGQSGSGKTTITQLLLNFYPPNQGSITIDNKPINDYPLFNLRQNIGIVPQDTVLFGGTIEENIRYGRPDASLEEIKTASIKANAMEFINSFPDGFSTIVGERGVQLSGGQRQRISIARAILKNPSILILDEATSALDAESEHQVQEALNELMNNRTSIIIAHRLSTIKNADTIIVMQNGVIVESGTHEELLEKLEGNYAHLIKMQLQ